MEENRQVNDHSTHSQIGWEQEDPENMTCPPRPWREPRFRKFSPRARWVSLVAASLMLGGILTWLGAPAAWLLGPMLAAIVLSVCGGKVQLPAFVFGPIQGVIGCLIVHMLPKTMTIEVFTHWAAFIFGVLSVIAASALLGWLMSRMHLLPGSALVWGLSPGAATVMTLMADAQGADAQLVALTQYSRVVLVAVVAAVVSRLVGGGALHPGTHATWFVGFSWLSMAETLAVALSGAWLGRKLGMSAGALLVPLVIASILTHHGWMKIVLPPWLVAIAYVFIGWRIGLRFTPQILSHAARVLPRIIACTIALITLCAGVAGLLVVFAGFDPLSAYLATSPGGVDSVAIITASTRVDAPVVMSMQMARFVIVLLTGPALAKYLARKAAAQASSPILDDLEKN
jgi:uncharacterized protein